MRSPLLFQTRGVTQLPKGGGSTSNISSAADIVETAGRPGPSSPGGGAVSPGASGGGVRGIISRFGKSDSQDSGFRSTSRERLRSDSRSPHRNAAHALRQYQNVPEVHSASNNNIRPTTSGAPKAVVTPTVYHEQPLHPNSFNMVDLSGKNHHSNNNNNAPSNAPAHYRSMEEIPTDLDALSVDQVCDCLKHLNMEQHVREFRRQQVDGNLLRGLNEHVLQKDFRFTEFNASKLMRFVRGWRPRFS